MIENATTYLATQYVSLLRRYDLWRLAQLRARLAGLPAACKAARDGAHETYVQTLRHIDKQQKVEDIELRYEIDTLERKLS